MPFKGRTRQSSVMGIFCIIANVVMYGSPLVAASEVFRSKSVEYMPLSLTLGMVVCSMTWMSYGILGSDPFVIVPNAIGVALGFAQVGLYAWFFNWSPPKKLDWRQELKLPPKQEPSAEMPRGWPQWISKA